MRIGGNYLNGCNCPAPGARSAAPGQLPTWLDQLVFQNAPIATVGVSFSNAELIRAAAFMAAAVFIGSYLSKKIK